MKSTYIWGAGHRGVLTALDCEQRGVEVAGFIDSRANQIKTKLGLPVLTLEQVQSQKPQVIIAIQNENAVKEISEKLKHRGMEFTISKDEYKDAVYQNLAYNHMINIVENRPLDINIEVVNKCPMKCCFCCNRKIKRNKQVMDMNLFKKICDDYYDIGGGGFALSSMQSDLFQDPLLMERLAYIKPLKDKFYVYTTNPLISIGKYNYNELKQILEVFNYITVSVLGLNKEDYAKMGGIDLFDKFIGNLERVGEIIEKNNLDTIIKLAYRTFKKEELESDVLYSKLNNRYGNEGIIDKFFSWSGSISQEDLPKGAIVVYKNNINERENCAAAVSTLSISSNGNVVGCGCIDWNEENVICNIKDSSILEIWGSEKAKRFRNAFENGRIPKICHECALYTSIKMAYSRPELLKYDVKDGIYWEL